MNKPIVGITMGDPAGSGPEITIKALADPEQYSYCRPIVVGDVKVMEQAKKFVGRKFFSARRTASSGRTAFRLARMIASASLRSVSFFSMSFSPFPSLLVRGQKTPVQSLPMQENAVQVF